MSFLKISQKIETEKLILRKHRVGDESEIFRLLEQNREYLSDVFLGQDHEIQNINQVKTFIKKRAAGWLLKKLLTFGIWYKTDEKLVGEILLFRIDWAIHKLEIGFYVAKNYQGKGIATEAAKACIKYAFEQIGINTIEATCKTKNYSSKRVIEKCGFIKQYKTIEGIGYYMNKENYENSYKVKTC